MSECLATLGHDDAIKIDAVFYLILLLAKQYVYKCKMDNAVLCIIVLRKKLAHRYKIEEYNAKLKMSYPEFRAKWFSYQQLCTDTTS